MEAERGMCVSTRLETRAGDGGCPNLVSYATLRAQSWDGISFRRSEYLE